jgi:uncharacterized protein (TIGR00369 family)
MAKIFEATNPDFEKTVRESFARQGLMGHLGAWLLDVAPGHVTIELPLASKLTQQAGHFHGGVIGAVADSAGGYAALSLMPVGSEVVTVEYKINFMRPAAGPLLRATADVIRPGKTITVVRIECLAGEASALVPCAVLQATFMRVAA